MAIKKKFDGKPVPVQLAKDWRDRIQAVSDHPRINDSLAAVIRDCVETALPGFELNLGIRTLDDMEDFELEGLGVTREEVAGTQPAAPQKEDRAKGSFGYGER